MSEPAENLPNMRVFADAAAVIAGRFHLLEYLSEGNFGAVYRAAHYAYGRELRRVAIKIAKRPMTDGQARQVFGDALVMAKVQDAAPPEFRARFVTVYDAGTCSDGALAGHPYVVMELVEGGSLKGSLEVGPFPLKRAVATFDQILEAMACVHSEHFVHRDLKPSNILISRRSDRDDVIKVTDFGLAQQVESLLGWIDSAGDLAHLAPECFTLNICSPKTDVYMLGLIFYEMLTGTNPFADVGLHLGGRDKLSARELTDLHLKAREVQRFELLERHEQIKLFPALGGVIRGALSSSMEGRPYNNPAELKVAWDRAKTSGPPPPPPPDEHPWDKVRRMVEQAERAGLPGAGEGVLDEAMKLNRNKRQVPDNKMVGKAYLLQVRMLLRNECLEEAWGLANEGLGRRKCKSTWTAVAAYYQKAGEVKLASDRDRDAETCADKD